MIKAILKMLLSGKRLAGYSADFLSDAVNSAPDERKTALAGYAANVDAITQISAQVAEIVKDGTISDAEREKIQTLLTPLFDKMLDLI